MSRLASEAELVARLDESNCLDKKLVEDFRCSICLCFSLDPVMCSECEHVFCLQCRKGYYNKPVNVTCSDCRVTQRQIQTSEQEAAQENEASQIRVLGLQERHGCQ